MPTIKLVVKGIGHAPSFKNNKMLTRGMLITNPKNQKWMKKAAASIVSQLTSLYQTEEIETRTGQSLQEWIVSSLPLDDSLAWTGVPCGNWRRVKKESEGLEIKISENVYCHNCGNKQIINEGPAEGYWCPKCGSSDSDE